MPLPTTKTPPCLDLSRLKALVYGLPKLGKSTFCAGFPDAIFLATERGLDALSVHQLPITNWKEMTDALGEIAEGGHKFKTVIIDTIDNAFAMCVEHFTTKHKVEYVGDLPFGKGFGLVKNEFRRVLTKLSHLPYGLVLVSHAKTKTVETPTGEIEKTTPTIPDQGRDIVLAFADLVLYVDQEDVKDEKSGKRVSRRVIRTKRTANYEAGDRTARLPETLPLEFDAFAAAFTTAKAPEDKKNQKTTKTDTQPALPAPAAS